MGNRFSSGKNSISQCDRCNFRFRLHELKTEIIKTKPYQIKVCSACWDPDHPQLQLGMYPVDDPQGVRDPRPDITYLLGGNTGLQITNTPGTGLDESGTPSGGSRVIQWGWNPVGGSTFFTANETPNNLVSNVQLGTVEVLLEQAPGAFLTGVSSVGEVGNALGPLPITGVETTGSVGNVAIPLYISGVSSSSAVGTAIQSPSVSINIPGAILRYSGTGNWIVRVFWNTGPNQALVQQLSDQLANAANGQVWLYSDAVYGVPFGEIPAAPGPEVCFGRFYQVNYFPSFGFADFYVEGATLPSPVAQLGDWNVYSYLRAQTQFSIPCPNNGSPVFPDPAYGGYNPTYVNNGTTCTLTWVGNAAATLNSTYQASASVIGTYAYARWSDTLYSQPGITMGRVTDVTYIGGAFTVTMTTITAPTAGAFTVTPIVFMPSNPGIYYLPPGVESTVPATALAGRAVTLPAVSCPGEAISVNYLYQGYLLGLGYYTTLGSWILNSFNSGTLTGVAYDHVYMFADFGSGYVGIGYAGSFQVTSGPAWQAGIYEPLPSTAPAIGNYTISNFAVGAQFYIIGNTANQYASYSVVGGVATFTWTGTAAATMRDTYAQYPTLPVGTEISAAVFVRSTFTWSPSQLYLGTFLSMGYSSGTFTLTYTVVNAFVPYPGGEPSVGMMYFNTAGITFLPLVINI